MTKVTLKDEQWQWALETEYGKMYLNYEDYID
jgi:hypothetical protein